MKVPVLSAPLIMGSFRASGSSPCTCPSNCSSVSKQRHSSFLTSNQTGQKLLMGGAYISSPYGIAENRCHWHRCHAAHIWLRPGDSDLFLFPASIRIHTNVHCSAFKMGKGNQPLAQVQQSSVWHSQKTPSVLSDTWRRWCLNVPGPRPLSEWQRSSQVIIELQANRIQAN